MRRIVINGREKLTDAETLTYAQLLIVATDGLTDGSPPAVALAISFERADGTTGTLPQADAAVVITEGMVFDVRHGGASVPWG